MIALLKHLFTREETATAFLRGSKAAVFNGIVTGAASYAVGGTIAGILAGVVAAAGTLGGRVIEGGAVARRNDAAAEAGP